MKIALLPGGSMTSKRIQIFTEIARSLNMKVLDITLLKDNSDQ